MACCCGDVCCPDRCCEGDEGCENPWPATLTIELSDPSAEGCWDMSGTLTLLDCVERSYGGTLTGSCTWCSQTFDMSVEVLLTCGTPDGWILDFELTSPAGDCGGLPPDTVLTEESCDPILLSADIDCFDCASMICEIPDPPNPPMPFPHDPFCISVLIYE